MFEAAQNGNTQGVEALLAQGVDVHAKNDEVCSTIFAGTGCYAQYGLLCHDSNAMPLRSCKVDLLR